MIKFVDIFSGIGGFREGLTRAGGFECVGHCEIDKYANRSYNALFDTKGEWFIEDAAQKQHIDIQFEVNDLSPLQIELIDCTVVLGNLLDNAIEACLKLEEAKRRIEVSVLRDEAYADGDAKLYVSIINTSLPVHIEKDCIATTKLEPHKGSSDVVRGVFIYIVSCIFLGTLLIISTIIITAEFKLKQNGCLPPHSEKHP